MINTLVMELQLILLYAVIVIANIITGLQYNINIRKINFDWIKLLNGIVKSIVIGLGIILGTIPIAMLPNIISNLGIQLDYANEISILIIFTIIANGIFYYSKSFINNLKNIFKGGNENE